MRVMRVDWTVVSGHWAVMEQRNSERVNDMDAGTALDQWIWMLLRSPVAALDGALRWSLRGTPSLQLPRPP